MRGLISQHNIIYIINYKKKESTIIELNLSLRKH